MPKAQWTRNDEERRQALMQELDELSTKRGKAWDALHQTLIRTFGPEVSTDDVNKAINDAGALRDALEPFDDGVRQADEAAR